MFGKNPGTPELEKFRDNWYRMDSLDLLTNDDKEPQLFYVEGHELIAEGLDYWDPERGEWMYQENEQKDEEISEWFDKNDYDLTVEGMWRE